MTVRVQCLESKTAPAGGDGATADAEVLEGARNERLPDAPRCAGIAWRLGKPRLLVDAAEDLPLELGSRFAVRLGERRQCIGTWHLDERRPCPFQEPLDTATTSAQCQPCAAADPGRAVAKDTVLDNRRFHLYLAWFGPGLIKVGICAVHRGLSRLHEQGALASTWLASGRHGPIRQMEKAIAEAGIAVERYRHDTKTSAWWAYSTPERRHNELRTAHQRAQAIPNWPKDVDLAPCLVVDHTHLYGLADLPLGLDRAEALQPGAVVAGRLCSVIGSNLVLDNANGPVVVDARLLAGWTITPVEANREHGVERASLRTSAQQTLF
ncbi:DUF2797 domain-containing protein [Thermocrispum sp.]|uniref:DUF2797 domain-containing protein n=1 Tax=Thermocrispum sp. TaxID=2060768 RepID=UPI0025811388|nr:DUF2797 domain-containing protein [Thermocrispum sp.]